jgi:hypothetical protein
VQGIDVHGEFEKRVVTLLVMSAFLNSAGASRACADFRDPTAVFRIMIAFSKARSRPSEAVDSGESFPGLHRSIQISL